MALTDHEVVQMWLDKPGGSHAELVAKGRAEERNLILAEVLKEMDCRSDNETDFERGRYYAAGAIQSFIYRRRQENP